MKHKKPSQELRLEGGVDNGPLFNQTWLKEPKSKIRHKHYLKHLRRATPPWADKVKILEVYKKAKRMSKVTGKRFSVDHLIPLRGETVCGLHVHNNLEVTLHTTNMRKGNKWYPEQMEIEV